MSYKTLKKIKRMVKFKQTPIKATKKIQNNPKEYPKSNNMCSTSIITSKKIKQFIYDKNTNK